MPYSHLPIPNTPSTRIIDTDTYIYIAPPNHPMGKTGSAGSWTGATFGSDSTGDGSFSRPYATLRKAWQKAQEYIIQGNARMYIQFQKGIYGYTFDFNDRAGTNPFPDNLYHPQGERIIIQGDLEAIRQRYLYRVKDYAWDLSRLAYYGHTGTVNLWYGQHALGLTSSSYPNGTGTTAHGFSAQDEMGYVSIVNAAQSTPCNRSYTDLYNGIYTNGRYSMSSGSPWFRSHLNHGLSYEEAKGIQGIARIENASANSNDLRLQFKNLNLDARIAVYPGTTLNGKVNGGLDNTLSFIGSGTVIIPNNYPEPQYSEPNGYYGPTLGVLDNCTLVGTTWGNDNGAVTYGVYPPTSVIPGGVSLSYPDRESGDVHITDDPHVLTNFPVVIKVYAQSATGDGYQQKPVPFLIDGGRVGAIRNIMLVNGDIEGISYSRLPNGQTLAPCHMMDTAAGTAIYDNRTRSFAGMMLLNGAKVKIRNLGMVGWGTVTNSAAIMITDGSELGADLVFEEDSYYNRQGAQLAGTPNTYAELGRLYNTPIFLTTNGGGIHCDAGSKISLLESFDASTALVPRSLLYGLFNIWIQTSPWNGHSGIIANQSEINLPSTAVHNYGALPGGVRLSLTLPVFSGATVFGGATAMFLHPSVLNNSGGRGVTYSSIVAYSVTPSGGRTPFARILYVTTNGETFASVASPANEETGWTNAGTTVTVSSGTAPTLASIQNQPVLAYGIMLNQHQNDSYLTLKNFFAAGNTLEFYAYQDIAEGITAPGGYAVGPNGCFFRTPAGITLTLSKSGMGFSYGIYGPWAKDSLPSTFLSHYYNAQGYGINLRTSRCTHSGTLDMSGKNYIQIYMLSASNWYGRGSLMHIMNGAHTNLYIENSKMEVIDSANALLTRQCQLFGYDSINSRGAYPVFVGYSGKLTFAGTAVSINSPLARRAITSSAQFGGYTLGLGTTLGPEPTIKTVFDSSSLVNCPRISHDGELHLTSDDKGNYPFIVGYEGGVDSTAYADTTNDTTTKGAELSVYLNAKLHGYGSLMNFWNTTQVKAGLAGSGAPGLMTRQPYGTNATNNQQLLYNSPRGASMWFIAYPTGTGKTRNLHGWYGTSTPTNGSNNGLYMSRIGFTLGPAASEDWYSPAVFNTLRPQRSGGFTADPPGYTGAAVYTGYVNGYPGPQVSTYYYGSL